MQVLSGHDVNQHKSKANRSDVTIHLTAGYANNFSQKPVLVKLLRIKSLCPLHLTYKLGLHDILFGHRRQNACKIHIAITRNTK